MQEKEKDECFKVDLISCSEGAKLGRVKKTIVTIVNDDGMSDIHCIWANKRITIYQN